MVETTRSSTELNRQRDPGGNPREQSEERAKAEPIAQAENNRVGNRSSEQAQRAVLASQQIIGKIKASQNTET